MFKGLSLKSKLLTVFILIGLVPFTIVAIISLNQSRNEISVQIEDKLMAIQEIKSNQIRNFFNERFGDIRVLSGNRMLEDAMVEYNNAFKTGGIRSKAWESADNEYGGFLTFYTDEYGYYDLFLINTSGDIVYTAAKEGDFGLNVLDSQLSGSPLADVYRKASSAVSMVDFKWYSISQEPACFVGVNIYDQKDQKTGVLVFQISLKCINAIMQERTGMGETGETYLVGEDNLMRSDSYLDPENHSVEASFKNPSLGAVKTQAVRNAFAGASNVEIIVDYNGNNVLSAYSAINIGDFKWAVLSEQDESEAFRSVNQLTLLIIIIAVVTVSAILLVAFLFANSIEKPISKIVESLYESSEQVAAASEQLSSASQQLAEGSSEQASSLEETSATLNESSSMIQRTTENTTQASEMSDKADRSSAQGREEMTAMMQSMRDIKSSSDEISKIIKVIDDIAFQTNILSLNAAVEGARAGEAGAGFAVVADEVRTLAQRSAKAAQDTKDMIEKNITLSKNGVQKAGQVQKVLIDINEQSSLLSKLIEEVNVASREQAQGIHQINQAVSQMEQVTQQNAANAEETASSSEEMSAQAETLNSIVDRLNNLIHSTRHIENQRK